MLEDIREKKTNRVTYLLVVVAGIGMLFIGVPFFNHSGEINVATVNGQDIPQRLYSDTYRDLQQQQPNLSESELSQRAVRTLIERSLLEQHALDSRYRLSDSALYRIIKQQFGDNEKYSQFLSDNHISATAYQNSVRQEQSISAYYRALMAGDGNNNPLQQHYLQSQAQERGYTLYTIPRAPIAAAVNVEDAALEKHYQAHGERFSTPENVTIDYTIYDIADMPVSGRRSGRYIIIDDAKAAEDAASAIKNGEKTFADYWQAIGDKTLAGETGELALAAKGKGVDPKLDEALFALEKSGDVSPVIDTDFGKILLELGTVEAVDSSDKETVRRLARAEHEAAYTERANQAFDSAQSGNGLAAVLGITGGKSETLTNITADSDAAPWLHNQAVQAQLFGEKALSDNKLATPVEIAPQVTLFFTVTQREKPQPRPFADVRAQVEADYRNEQANTTLRERGEALKTALAAGKAEALIAEYQVQSETVAPTNRFAAKNPLVLDLFNRSERLTILDAPDGNLLVARLDSVAEGDPAKLPEAQRSALSQQWQLENFGATYNGIGSWLYGQAKIKINEEALQR